MAAAARGRAAGDFLRRAGRAGRARLRAASSISPLPWPEGWSLLASLQAQERGDAAATSQSCIRRVRVAACLHNLFFPIASFLVSSLSS